LNPDSGPGVTAPPDTPQACSDASAGVPSEIPMNDSPVIIQFPVARIEVS